jgi:signal transduction histidine kinase
VHTSESDEISNPKSKDQQQPLVQISAKDSYEIESLCNELENLRIQFETQKIALENAESELQDLKQQQVSFSKMKDDAEREQYERALEEANQRFAVAADSASLGVWEYNLLDNSLIWDDAMYRVFNVQPDEFVGVYEAWAACVHPDDLENAAAELQAAIRLEKQLDTFFRIIWKSGEVRYIKADARVMTNEEGVSYKIIGVNYDITSLKNAEYDLQRSFNLVNEQNKRLLNFSYIVSHNLRSHTSNIKAISNFLYDDETDPEKREMILHLKKVSNRLDDTLHNLNEVVSIQTNMNLVVEPLCLDFYVKRVLEILDDQILSKSVIVHNAIDPKLEVIYNPAYLESILLNTISNAIKYSHPTRQPNVWLKTAYEDQKLVLTIEDNGIGIDLEKHGDKIFGMYKTFHNNQDARGIGLFITKNQIEAMGGQITIASILDQGTTFKIYFA